MCSYKRGTTLAGFLYFRRISDVRRRGILPRNYAILRKLCGNIVFRNVIIVTNRWGEVDPQEAEGREAEMGGKDFFFRPVLGRGARMTRHDNTVPSAKKIIRLILPRAYPGAPSQATSLRTSVSSSASCCTAQYQKVTFIRICRGEVMPMPY